MCRACATLALVLMTSLAAGPAGAGSTRHAAPAGVAHAAVFDYARRLDVNHLNLFLTNFGGYGTDVASGGPGLEFPRGTAKTALYSAGLWLGAKVAGQRYVKVAEYSQEYGPGGMFGTLYDDPSRPEYVVYKVARFTSNPADTAHVDHTPSELSANPLLDPVAHHAWSEYIRGAKPYGAPTRIWRLPNTGTPDPNDSVNVEGPDVQGDLMTWAIYNDANVGNHTNEAGSTQPLGVEVRQTTYAYNRQAALGNTVFFKFEIFDRGVNTLDSMYVSLWSDPDLGGFADDLVGCDTTRSLGYVYNATNNDAIYGSAPPALGFVLLRGPVTQTGGQPLRMTSFNRYINGTDPQSSSASYNYMTGFNADGSPQVNPITGLPTRYAVTGDPVAGTGWLDTNAADRRMMLSAGPFHMAPGDTQTVLAALVIGQGTDRLSSISVLKLYTDDVRKIFQATAGVGDTRHPAAALALERPSPNPSPGGFAVAFTLPDAAPATLELLDIAGRRLLRRDVGALGAGRHSLRLAGAEALRPGIYLVRLDRNGESRVTRACVVR